MTKAATDLLYNFVYSGINRLGQKTTGEVFSSNMTLAKAQLRKQGITVKSIKRKPKPLFTFKKRIRPLDIAIFVRQLATMIKAGIPLIQSFDIVAESADKPNMKVLVLKVRNEVESGTPLATALSQHPMHFDKLFCALVAAGEQSGSLEAMLERLAVYKEKSELLKLKIKKAIKYPIAVITVAIAVTLILLIKVMPVFSDLFMSFGTELPVFTQFVVGLSEWMQTWWFILLSMTALVIISIIQAKRRNQQFGNLMDKLVLKLPIIGSLTHQTVVARFARTLSTTFAAGVPLIDALDSTSVATNNHVYYEATQEVKNQVASGQQLNYAMRNTQIFPSLAIQMVTIGEEAGSLDEMLDKVATYYEDQVDNAVDGLTSLLEPIIMVILGTLVGGLVIAMYLPIFQMGSVISG